MKPQGRFRDGFFMERPNRFLAYVGLETTRSACTQQVGSVLFNRSEFL